MNLADAHGLNQTASVLGLDYYSLKKRIDSTDSTPPTFVELSLPSPSAGGECVIEFDDDKGASMRVHLKGYEAPELVAFGRSLWNVD